MKKTQTAGGVVLNEKNDVLVVNQNGDSWSLPKGHIEIGEDEMTAARREIQEESGVTELEYIRSLGTYERYKIAKDGGEDVSELKQITLFLFRTDQTALVPQDPENPEARWVPKEQVADLLTHPKDKEYFLSILSALNTGE